MDAKVTHHDSMNKGDSMMLPHRIGRVGTMKA